MKNLISSLKSMWSRTLSSSKTASTYLYSLLCLSSSRHHLLCLHIYESDSQSFDFVLQDEENGNREKTMLKSSRSSIFGTNPAKNYDNSDASSIIARSVSLNACGGKQRLVAENALRHRPLTPSAQVFSFRELAAATDNFSAELFAGEGGFAKVYKGTIRVTNQIVAVKQLDRNGAPGNKDFLSEVLTLSSIHHPNLVNLIGYCTDGQQRILVFEYMCNGSLEEHLLDLSQEKKPLDWQTRMKIASGAAKGLEYLHDTANPQVIFQDLKLANILLDEEFNPKLSGFGQTKMGLAGHEETRLMGIYGYCAPEYAQTGQLTASSDVYSFGIVLLQIITGRRVVDNTKPLEEENLVSWAQPLFKDRRNFTAMVDPLLDGNYPLKGLHQALGIAATCLQDEPSTRPLIGDIVTALEFLTILTDEDLSEPETIVL